MLVKSYWIGILFSIIYHIMKSYFYFTLFLVLHTVTGQEALTCEPIKLELCTQYNFTGMPNLLGHQLQGDAKAGLEVLIINNY